MDRYVHCIEKKRTPRGPGARTAWLAGISLIVGALLVAWISNTLGTDSGRAMALLVPALACIAIAVLGIEERARRAARGREFALERERDELTARTRGAAEHAARLSRSNEELETFAYRASHDLQEPLRMVSSYVGLLSQRYAHRLDETGREFLEFAMDGARRMQELVTGLLELSRVETCGEPLEPVDCEELLSTVLRDLALLITESAGQVTHDLLPRVMGDRAQLAQLLANLLGNALKFHDGEPPRVHVSTRREADGFVLTVADCGIGVEPSQIEEMFEVFRRLNPQERFPGSGLGLAICRRIAERHGGWIRADSKPGEGTTFELLLPACPERESGGL